MSVNILKIKKPIWFMRQAGRHLPEYRKLRLKKKNFLDFCFDYESVVESTLQPIKRYDIDCAILFSDILVIPYLLNQNVKFDKGTGPALEKLNFKELLSLKTNESKLKDLYTSYNAIKKIRYLLNKNNSLIGFCGAPWTVSCYMIDGNSKNGFKRSQECLKKDKHELTYLLDKLVDVSIDHLTKQYENGCDTLMIFESWAGLVDRLNKNEILYNPVRKIIKGLRKQNVNAPIIVFPKGLGSTIIEYIDKVNADIFSVDFETDLEWLLKNVRKDLILQGNLDPYILLQGGKRLDHEAIKIKNLVKDRKHIFNVGHGLLPETPIKNVHKFIEIIRS